MCLPAPFCLIPCLYIACCKPKLTFCLCFCFFNREGFSCGEFIPQWMNDLVYTGDESLPSFAVSSLSTLCLFRATPPMQNTLQSPLHCWTQKTLQAVGHQTWCAGWKAEVWYNASSMTFLWMSDPWCGQWSFCTKCWENQLSDRFYFSSRFFCPYFLDWVFNWFWVS